MSSHFSNRLLRVVVVVALAAALAACAKSNPGETREGAGFLQGLFQGFIVLFALMGRWFGGGGVYEVYNTGGWYDSGYVLGVALFFGGAGGGAGSSSSNASSS